MLDLVIFMFINVIISHITMTDVLLILALVSAGFAVGAMTGTAIMRQKAHKKIDQLEQDLQDAQSHATV